MTQQTFRKTIFLCFSDLQVLEHILYQTVFTLRIQYYFFRMKQNASRQLSKYTQISSSRVNINVIAGMFIYVPPPLMFN